MHTGVLTTRLRRRSRVPLAPIAGALLALGAAPAAGSAGAAVRGTAQLEMATLTECVASSIQAERSATFAGEMTAVPGTTRMAVRIDVQELMPGEELFHTIIAPGLGLWRSSELKVKTYRYLKQVTDLSSPARYRARVRFRWLGAGARIIRHAELTTPPCTQPIVVPSASALP